MSDNVDNCIFCKIANGEMGTEFVASSDRIVAFNDIAPSAPTHILVIPKMHVQSAHDLNENHAGIWQEMLDLAQKVAVQAGIADSGYRLVTNIGPDSGQEVPHLHLHVLGGKKLGGIA